MSSPPFGFATEPKDSPGPPVTEPVNAPFITRNDIKFWKISESQFTEIAVDPSTSIEVTFNIAETDLVFLCMDGVIII